MIGYTEFTMDEQVVATRKGYLGQPDKIVKAHYAGLDQWGRPTIWANGRTSFTTLGSSCTFICETITKVG